MTSVLIIGGGFAGLTAAQALLKSTRHRVTLVDRKDFFEVTPAQLHLLVAPGSLGDRSRFRYLDVLGEHFVMGEVVRLEGKVAVLAQGQKLAFDVLVLATGTRYPRFPLAKPKDDVTLELRQESMLEETRRFQSAKSYLIVGGGLVGVELAGEIAAAAPGKPVRLAHRGNRLVEGLSPKASGEALSQLLALGVTVQLNTADAKPREGELYFITTTPESSTDFLASVQPEVLDDKGRILVNEGLQVKGHPDWYAIGDVNAAPDSKQAVVAAAQGKYLAASLMGSTKPYRPRPAMVLVPVGRRLGFSQMPFGVVKWKFLLDMKRKDYLVERIRKEMGAV